MGYELDESVQPFNRLNSLNAINRYRAGNLDVLKHEKWLMYLALTEERNVNLERLQSLDEMEHNYVLRYVEKTLTALSSLQLSEYNTRVVEETLKWAEVAKSGLSHQRQEWLLQGVNLFVHNIGSSQIYLMQSHETDEAFKQLVAALICTHGLIGQYIRGEIALSKNLPLHQLIQDKLVTADELLKILTALNYCVISAVDEGLWSNIENKVHNAIKQVINGQLEDQCLLDERLKRLRAVSIRNGESFDVEFQKIANHPEVVRLLCELLEKADLWYVEAALYDFSLEEFVKILLILASRTQVRQIRHVSFEQLMKSIYYQHEGKKRVNIYVKRIIEKYLSEITYDGILKGDFKNNPHVAYNISYHESLDDTVFFTFEFSKAGASLIDFCVEAEKSDVLYEKAIILLFDLFELRKDKYDRFYEEETYLQTMNQTINHKKVILDYLVGRTVVDIGPGGGALMDIIADTFPDKQVLGIDISQNVIDSLKKKKQLENKRWNVLYGDALQLNKYIQKESVDTIIYCSILHELFSYIPLNGIKFNYDTLAAAFKSAFSILPVGGRVIIRDGVMTEPESQTRIIRFLSEEGMAFLKRYAGDFEGRAIQYEIIGQNEVRMPVNDAMEFLYTYTWGEKSYNHEVQEQFGYFTPTGFKQFIKSVLGDSVQIITLKHYLQEGYALALEPKIEFFDGARKPIRLPDSTCLIVLEKIK